MHSASEELKKKFAILFQRHQAEAGEGKASAERAALPHLSRKDSSAARRPVKDTMLVLMEETPRRHVTVNRLAVDIRRQPSSSRLNVDSKRSAFLSA
jgi:hypothetical protein